MKRSRVSYDEWKCIQSKKIKGITVEIDLLHGYIGLINIEEVVEPQVWTFHGEDIIVCN